MPFQLKNLIGALDHTASCAHGGLSAFVHRAQRTIELADADTAKLED
jgi:hypothetical protein